MKNQKEIDRMMLKIVQTIAEDTIKKRKEKKIQLQKYRCS